MTIAILFLFLAGQAQAQRYLPRQRGIQLTGGFVDGFTTERTDGGAFYAALATSTYNGKGNRWVFGAEYLQKQFGYEQAVLPVSQITFDGGHYLRMLSDPGKTFFLSLGLSILAGYETRNRGETLLFDGSTIEGRDGFIGGGAVTLELEAFITDRIVFLVNARERAVSGSSIGRFHFLAGAGIKLIIK